MTATANLPNETSPREGMLLLLIALTLRLPAAWLIPNADGDAYTYAEIIGGMSAKLSDRTIAFTDLFGFWLPLFQFISALLASAFHLAPLLAGKLVSSTCGAGIAVLVFCLTSSLTHNRLAAWIAFALLSLDPFHLFYSALSLTDVPSAFFILLSLYAAVSGRWKIAVAAASCAGLIRVDAWLFLVLLPTLQFIRERRVSFAVIAWLLLPPILWLSISFAARGDAFAYFAERSQYVERYLRFDPARRGLDFAGADFYNLFVGAHSLVFPLALIASALALVRRRENLPAFICVSYFGALLAFVVAAYLARSQPVLWIRYGLIFFAIGIPPAASLVCEAIKIAPRRVLVVSSVFAALICVWQIHTAVTSILPTIRDHAAHRQIAEEIQRIARAENWNENSIRCFCDDSAVRVLSNLPTDRFVRSEGNENEASLIGFLRRNDARYLVFTRTEHSLPFALNPELAAAKSLPPFTLIKSAPSPNHYGPDLLLYRLDQSR